MAATGSSTDLSSLLSDTSSRWTAASIASQLTLPLLSSLPSHLPSLSHAAVRLLLLALLQCRPAVLLQARDAVRGVLDECDRSEDEWVRWLAGRLRDYESTEPHPARPNEQDRALVQRVQQAVRATDNQPTAVPQQGKEERKEEEEVVDGQAHTPSLASGDVHGSAFLPCLPYYSHFLSPQLLPTQLTTTELLPFSAPSSSLSPRLRLVSPSATHFSVRRRFLFFDRHNNSDDSSMADVEAKHTNSAAVSTSPAPPPVFAPPAVPVAPSTPSAAAASMSSIASPSPPSAASTPRRIVLPSAVPHIHPRVMQSPSSAASPLALAASRLGTRPSLPSPALTRQPSLHRPMSNPKAGRSVVMIGLEEAGGLTDVKQRVREEKEKERREKEEERRQEAERKKEEKERERREKEEEKRVEAERRREEKEEKERQRRAEKEEKEKKRLEWHRVREEKAKVREDKKKRDEEVHKQQDDEAAAAVQQPDKEREQKEQEEAVERRVEESSTRSEAELKQSPPQLTSAEPSELKYEESTVNGQSSLNERRAAGNEQSSASMDFDSTTHTPTHSTLPATPHVADGTPRSEQQLSDGYSADTSPVHSPVLHPLPALPDTDSGLVESEEAKRKRREERKRRKQEKQEQQQAETDQPPPPSEPQQLQPSEEDERERKKRKKEKKKQREKEGHKKEKARTKEKSAEKAESEPGKAASSATVVKRHRPSCKRKA